MRFIQFTAIPIIQFFPGDTIGIGLEGVGDENKGNAYFTHNGTRLGQVLESVDLHNLYPAAHIQKKEVRIRANFGQNDFVYKDAPRGRAHLASSEAPTPEPNVFEVLPCGLLEEDEEQTDDDAEEETGRAFSMSAGHRRHNPYACRPALKQKVMGRYDIESTMSLRLQRSGNPLFKTGPLPLAAAVDMDEDSDDGDDDDVVNFEEDSEGSDYGGHEQAESVNALLVKIWESRVFPVIRRRFRNETERRDGLEQIKGALSLGMADIARQTVEFLYEENGGIPGDLVLPTIEDVKEEMSKFTIDKIKKGDLVKLMTPPHQGDRSGGGQEANFSCLAQLKTFGLHGEVLDVDRANELILVESYLRGDGVLVRFWYPLAWLERPKDGRQKKTTITGICSVDVRSAGVHKELLNAEFAMSRVHCREAYLHLVEHSRHQATLAAFGESEERVNSSMTAMLTSSVMLLQDIDVENAQHISNAALRCNRVAGNSAVVHCEALDCRNDERWALGRGSLLDIFYADREPVRSEMRRMIERASSQSEEGENRMIELSDQLCDCLRHPSDFFHTEEIVINDRDASALRSIINFREASFVTMTTKLSSNLGPTYPPGLQIQVKLMEGPEIKKNGQISSKIVAQIPYPTGGGGNDSHVRAFPEVILATDTVCVSQSGGGSDVFFTIDDIPQQFPLALSFIEEALQAPGASAGVLFHFAEHLCCFLSKCHAAPLVKAHTFLLTAKVIKAYVDKSREEGRPHPLQLPMTSLFQGLRAEALMLESVESKNHPTRFSNYFQALLELTRVVDKAWHAQVKAAAAAEESGNAEEQAQQVAQPHADSFDCLEKVNKCLARLCEVQCSAANGGGGDISPLLGTVNARKLLVIEGLPEHVNARQTHDVVAGAFEPFGGLCSRDIYIHRSGERPIVVVAARAMCKVEKAKKALERRNPFSAFTHNSDAGLQVCKVDGEFSVVDGTAESAGALKAYLAEKLLGREQMSTFLTEVFQSAYFANCSVGTECPDAPVIRLGRGHILLEHKDNQMASFFHGLKKAAPTADFVAAVLSEFGTATRPPPTKATAEEGETAAAAAAAAQEPMISLEEFIAFAHAHGTQCVESVAAAVEECGYDLDLKRVTSKGWMNLDDWDEEKAVALSNLINETASTLRESPFDLHPTEIFLSKEYADMREYHSLRDVAPEVMSRQVTLLQVANSEVEAVLPMIRMGLDRAGMTDCALQLHGARSFIFSELKERTLKKQLDDSALRPADDPAPEVSLDPLEIVGKGAADELEGTWFYQAMLQLADEPSERLCAPTARGGDPQFSFNVKMRGVEGTSGSFRHFLNRVTEELHAQALSLLLPYMGAGPFRGRFLLRPGPMTVRDEKLLTFLGQLIGVSVRAGIPLVLDLAPAFWESLLGRASFDDDDLRLYDPVTMNHLDELGRITSDSEFEHFLEENQFPKFTYPSITGDKEEIMADGDNVYLTLANRNLYAEKVKAFKLAELRSEQRIRRILFGMGTVIPVDTIMTLFTAAELENLVCGKYLII